MTGNDGDAMLDEFARSASLSVAACSALEFDAIASRLAADGLLGVLAPEEAGGLGLPVSFAVPIVASAAASLLPFPVIETIKTAAVLGRHMPDVASAIVRGEQTVTTGRLACDEPTSGEPGTALSGEMRGVAFANQARWLVAEASLGSGSVLAAIDLHAVRAGIEQETDFDAHSPRFRIRLDDVDLSAARLIRDTSSITDFRAIGLILRAADQAASAEKALQLAIEHVSSRRQFGKPLVSFQAIRHELARARLVLEGLGGLVERAAKAGPDRLYDAELAYGYAAAKCQQIIEKCLQFHGGMGFTDDVAVHRHLRRVWTNCTAQGVFDIRRSIFDRTIGGRQAVSLG